jgi:hypothetical protein
VPGAAFVYRRSEFQVAVRFNRDGMRDVPRSRQKAPGVLRVALLGDSFVEAMQVPEDSMLSLRLERSLHSCVPGRRAEVLNFGVSGFGPAGVTARYATLAREFAPDLVVYLFVMNDPWDLVQHEARLYEIRDGAMLLRPLEPGGLERLLRRLVDFGKHHFHAFRFLKYRFLRLRQAPQRAAAEEAASEAGDGEMDPGGSAWHRTRLALGLLRDLAAEDGATLLVAQATTAGPKMNARLSGLCGDLGVPFLSLLPALESAPGEVFFRVDGHWRSAGHGVASRAMTPWICSFLQGPGERRDTGSRPGTSGGESDL